MVWLQVSSEVESAQRRMPELLWKTEHANLFLILEPFATLRGPTEWYLLPPKCCFHLAHCGISRKTEMHTSRHVVWYQAQCDSMTNVRLQLNKVPEDFFFPMIMPRDFKDFDVAAIMLFLVN